jgi:Beta-lactamase enzyme family
MALRMLIMYLFAWAPTTTLKEVTPYTALERVLVGPTLKAEWFAESFLIGIPLTKVAQVLASVQTEFGPYQSIQPFGENFHAIYERGKQLVKIKLNDLGQINYLLLKPVAVALAPEEAIEILKSFPGQTNLLILEEDRPIASYNSDLPLAVASSFKLAVLTALQEKIENGDLSWNDVIELRPEDKSFGGFLVNWFDGAVLTVESLAALMISVSENTATDTLMHLLGREAIIPYESRNKPLLTTREAFVLKSPINEDLLQRYRNGNLSDRLVVLDEVALAPPPDPKLFTNTPTALDVEFFYTPQELCDLMSKVADLPLMIINPGISGSKSWERVAFKGGSEPGVLNVTLLLKSKEGKTYRVSATWNNASAALDEAVFIDLINRVVVGLLSR